MSHDRTAMHSGTDIDLIVLLAAAVGVDPAGTDLHTVLAGIDARIRSVEQRDPLIGTFSLAAVHRRTVSSTKTLNAILRLEYSSTRTLDALLRRTESATATLDAFILGGTVLGSLAFDSILLRGASGSFTADAILRSAIGGSFTLDAIVVWADEFDDDLSQWTAKEWVFNPGYRVHPSQVSISGGLLSLTSEREDPDSFVSGTVYTNRTFDHGYFEARMKWPMGTGFDCAFWLYPEGDSTPAPEIDILEAYPNDPYVWPGPNRYQATMHYVVGGSPFQHQVTHDAGYDLTDTWHIVGAEWIPGERITFYFNGANIGSITDDVLDGTTPLNLNFSLIVGTWSAPADATTPDLATMEIDWVKWWDVKPTSGFFFLGGVIRRTISGSFTVDAVILKTASGSFSMDAVIADRGFTLDAVIESVGGSEDFQSDAFQGDAFE